jgi:hypothetical protein
MIPPITTLFHAGLPKGHRDIGARQLGLLATLWTTKKTNPPSTFHQVPREHLYYNPTMYLEYVSLDSKRVEDFELLKQISHVKNI